MRRLGGEVVSAEVVPPIRDEQIVRAAVAEIYRPEGVEIWMHAPNRMLGGESPLDLIAAGRSQRVLDLINALAEGITS